ncbi:hypothetical protein VM1G_06805 [Cytospora mali]|uniref:NodB homology domain-containing protein n=1 Tax=Cytospora mali TaxID=578113 RepID=A0A194W636_CYTMA|nr:hypothetical protein VM1G_06805 [Valsa mali]
MTANHPTNPWPNGAKCAISFTMDNLGEAQDVNKGLWPSDKPIGQHPSVLHTLPRILDLLDQQHGASGNSSGGGIKATYFAESWSLHVYPDAVRALRGRGHEVAWHGYQHETWHELSGEEEEEEEEEEEASFARSFAEAAAQGVAHAGFRPPGAAAAAGMGRHYVSPLGEFGIADGVVVLPFLWETVDAFWYMPKFAAIRKQHGTSEDRFEVLREVLARISSDDEIWCAPCGEVATWLRHTSIKQAPDTLKRAPDIPLPLRTNPHLRRDKESRSPKVTSQPLALLTAEHLLDGHHVRPLDVLDVPGQVLLQLHQGGAEGRARRVPHGVEGEQLDPEEGKVLLAAHGVLVALARAARRPGEDEEVHGHEVPRELPAEALLELVLARRGVGADLIGERGVEPLEGAVVALDSVRDVPDADSVAVWAGSRGIHAWRFGVSVEMRDLLAADPLGCLLPGLKLF